MMTAERKIPPEKPGQKEKWKVLDGRRNEALDCRNYARAMACSLNADSIPDEEWDALDEILRSNSIPQPQKQSKRRVISKGIKSV